MLEPVHCSQDLRGRQIWPGIAGGSHSLFRLRHVIPPLLSGIIEDAADNAFQRFAHGGVRVRCVIAVFAGGDLVHGRGTNFFPAG